MVVIAALAIAGLAGCGGSSTGTATPSASSNGVADLPADQILAKATTAAKAQTSVHVAGKGSNNGQAFGLDMRLRAGGGGIGSVSIGTDKIQLVSTGTDVYIKADKAYWTTSAGAATAAVIGDRWVKAAASSAAFAPIAQLGDFTTSLENYLKPDSTITKGDQSTVDGQPAIALVSTNGKLWVATTGQPLPLKIDSGKQGDALSFSDWGKAVDVKVPTDSETLDIGKLSGS